MHGFIATFSKGLAFKVFRFHKIIVRGCRKILKVRALVIDVIKHKIRNRASTFL